MTLPAPLQVFIGATVGGAIRLGIDHLVPAGSHGIPWDVVAINIVGSFVLGVVASRDEAVGGHRHFPLIGPGLLGGFTTFSAVATLAWSDQTDPGLAVVVLTGNLICAVAAAAWGWSIGSHGSSEGELVENLANEPNESDAPNRPSNGEARP